VGLLGLAGFAVDRGERLGAFAQRGGPDVGDGVRVHAEELADDDVGVVGVVAAGVPVGAPFG